MLGKGIANGKNKNFYSLIGKKFLNKKSFPYGKKLILILFEKEISLESTSKIFKRQRNSNFKS